MNKKTLMFGLVAVIVFSGMVFFRLSDNAKKNVVSNTPRVTTMLEKPLLETIAEEFSKKYKRPTSDFVIAIDIDDGTYAKGTVRFKEEMSGGLWFAAKTNGEWRLIFDGNGIIECSNLKDYPNFPTTLIPQCFDKNNGILIKR